VSDAAISVTPAKGYCSIRGRVRQGRHFLDVALLLAGR